MIFSKAGLRHIKWGALTFLAGVGMGGTVLLLTASKLTQARQEQQAAQRKVNDALRQLAEARNRLTASQDDQRNAAAYTAEYARLVDRKIIGSEQRLDWIEGLDNMRKQNRVLSFTYTINPQHPYKPDPALDSGNFDLNLSPMNLQLYLLHEAQLIDFFDTLRTAVKGNFILEHCSLSRSGAAFEGSSAPQLKAECSGGWLTLKNRNEK